MKYTIYIITMVLSLVALNSCQEKKKNPNQFILKGEIKGLTGNLYFRHPDKDYSGQTAPDTIFVKDGKINFTDSISDLTLIRAYTDSRDKTNKLFKRSSSGGYYPVKSMYFMFYAFSGAEITVQGEATDFMNAYPGGDKYNNSLAEINKIAFPYYNNSVNLIVQSSFEKDSVEIQELTNKAEDISEKGRQERINYVQAHPESLAALWYLEDMLMRKEIEDSVAIVTFKNVPPHLAKYDTYKAMETRISGIKETQIGMTVPHIKTTATLDGEEFDITSLKGKYVLIDFWGVWCGPCVAEMPQVKEFQEKYRDKLVVLGINSGDTKEKMQKFLNENEYAWQQLMSSKENTDDNFVNRFNVKGFPTKFIIDPEGKIVKRYVGSGEDAFTLLEELLDKKS